MDFIHEAVPEAGNDEEEEHAAQQMDVEQFLQVVAHDEKNQGGQCGQGKAYRAFGENGKGGHDIGGPVPAAVFCIAEVEKARQALINRNSVASVMTAFDRSQHSTLVMRMMAAEKARDLLYTRAVNQYVNSTPAVPISAEGSRAANSVKPNREKESASSQ